MSKRKSFLIGGIVGAVALVLLAATPSFQSFNSNQFGTNAAGTMISIKSGVILSNVTTEGTNNVNRLLRIGSQISFNSNGTASFGGGNASFDSGGNLAVPSLLIPDANGFYVDANSVIHSFGTTNLIGWSVIPTNLLPAVPVSIANGGTSATTAAGARTALGIGTAGTNAAGAFIASASGNGTNTTFESVNLKNTNFIAGSGTVSSSTGSQFFTNSGTGFANLKPLETFAIGVDQYIITKVVSSSVLNTFAVSLANYSGSAWTYSTNVVNFYDIVPRIVGGIATDGAIGVQGQADIANSGGFYLLGGTNSWFLTHDFDPTEGWMMSFRSANSGGGFPATGVVRVANQAPFFSFQVQKSGRISITGITNLFGPGNPVAIDVPITVKALTVTNASTLNTVTGNTGAFSNSLTLPIGTSAAGWVWMSTNTGGLGFWGQVSGGSATTNFGAMSASVGVITNLKSDTGTINFIDVTNGISDRALTTNRVLVSVSTAAGTMISNTSTAGTDGQFLMKSNAVAGGVTWAAVSGGGGSQTPLAQNVDAAGFGITNGGTFAAGLLQTTSITPSTLLATDPNGILQAVSSVSATEASYLDGVTSGIQTQLDGKVTASSVASNSLTLVKSNFVVGTPYTNTNSYPVIISGLSAILTEAAVAGSSSLDQRVNGAKGVTNSVSQITAIGALTGSMTNSLAAVIVDTNAVISWVDTSTGIGNSVTITGGQISYVNPVIVASSGQYASLTVNGTVHSSTNVATESMVTNYAVSNFVAKTTNTGFVDIRFTQAMEYLSSAAIALGTNNSIGTSDVYIPAMTTISTCAYNLSVGVAGGLGSFGLYDPTGTTKLVDTGPLAMTTGDTGAKLVSFTPVVITNGGWCRLAWTANSTTITFLCIAAPQANGLGVMNIGTRSVYGWCTNVSVAGQLPASQGGIGTGSIRVPLGIWGN